MTISSCTQMRYSAFINHFKLNRLWFTSSAWSWILKTGAPAWKGLSCGTTSALWLLSLRLPSLIKVSQWSLVILCNKVLLVTTGCHAWLYLPCSIQAAWRIKCPLFLACFSADTEIARLSGWESLNIFCFVESIKKKSVNRGDTFRGFH